MPDSKDIYDVVIIGGGASGSSLLYTLARYTTIGRIVLVEKYPKLGSVNSNAVNNSQTLHVGDIETNYTLAKTREVYPAAMMVKQYTDTLPESDRTAIIRPTQKMVLGVGENEVTALTERFAQLKEVFPQLKLLDGAGIAEIEPEVMRGRDPAQPVCALYNTEGYAVDYGKLAESLVNEAIKIAGDRISLFLATAVSGIIKSNNGYTVSAGQLKLHAKVVIVDADAYCLSFAKKLGLGKEFSLIPIGGSFFFTPEKLRGKVYRVQEKSMPFAAIHGDPDLTREHMTRWGPTARFFPVLEARNLSTMWDFLRASGLHRWQTWMSFFAILLEPIRFNYLFKNLLYELPFVGKRLLLPDLRKIVPSLTAADVQRATGYGGMRLQRVDTRSRELLLGEGKIIGDRIIFNMTPSPGASVALYNAMRDAEQIAQFRPEYVFDKERMMADLYRGV